MNAEANNEPVRFVARSSMSLPIFSQEEFFEEEVQCMVWGRWYPATGLLWIECVVCEDHSYSASQLSQYHVDRFEDALVNELGMKHF